MARDLLQIALEHHRAGRFRQAEAGYGAVVDAGPDHADYADALHWLGVLTFQAGRAAEAAALLARAVAARPADPAFLYNLGHACLAAGRVGEAVAAFDRAATLEPARHEAQVALARALLARKSSGDAEAAVAALERARAAGLDSAELHHDLGVALLAAGRADDAIPALRTALSKQADYASAYHHLALAHRARGETKEVRRNLNKALEVDPANARAWYALAALDAEAGNLEQSAALFRRAVRAKADYAAAYQGLARVLERLGRRDEAAAALDMAERAARGEVARPPTATTAPAGEAAPAASPAAELEARLTLDPTAARFHQALAALANVFPPTQVPPQEVTDLFDRYADRFDGHLVGQLGYRAPELIAKAVKAAVAATRPAAAGASPPLLDVLDLGCGTGLCGPLLRPLARTLAGVDLSPAMIDKAAARGVYDRLDVGDLVATLARTPAAWDVLVAADVLLYLGDLAPTFEAAAAALRPGGLLAVTVEAGGGERYMLNQQTRRYMHSEPYLRRLAAMYGFAVEAFETTILRMNRGQAVAGYLVVLRAPGV